MRVSRRFSICVVWGSRAKRSAEKMAFRRAGGVGLGLRSCRFHWRFGKQGCVA